MGRDASEQFSASPDPVSRPAEGDPKVARLAQALRDNLKRRKDQARGRDRAAAADGQKPAVDG